MHGDTNTASKEEITLITSITLNLDNTFMISTHSFESEIPEKHQNLEFSKTDPEEYWNFRKRFRISVQS